MSNTLGMPLALDHACIFQFSHSWPMRNIHITYVYLKYAKHIHMQSICIFEICKAIWGLYEGEVFSIHKEVVVVVFLGLAWFLVFLGHAWLAGFRLQNQTANLDTCPAPEFHRALCLLILHFAKSVQVVPVLGHFQDVLKGHWDSAAKIVPNSANCWQFQ